MMKPLCFVLMPFGRKPDNKGRLIDFDAIYKSNIEPAVRLAGMDSIRADEEQIGGAIHKPMYERLMLCEYAVADVTGANPNVYYELGIRHALRPKSTVIIFAEGTALPFDIALLRGLPYAIGENGLPARPEIDARLIADRLAAAHNDPSDDSPLFQLIDGMPHPEVDHAKTDIFRERATYSKKYKDLLSIARTKGVEAVTAIADDPDLGNLKDVEAGVIVDLYLSFRDVKAYGKMIELYDRMPKPLQRTRLVCEQLGFALNRLGRHMEAERVMVAVIAEHGASSETNGILGRIFKDRWEAAKNAGQFDAAGYLKRAIGAYLEGFEADWRDPYPGINAVTLMEMQQKVDPRQADLLPVVRYAATKRAERSGDYWDHATLLEAAILARNSEAAEDALNNAAAYARASWELETTARNISLIRQVRHDRGEDVEWIDALNSHIKSLAVRLQPR